MKKLIKSIPENIEYLEDTVFFKMLLDEYSKEIRRKLSPSDFMEDLFLLEDFDSFIKLKALTWELPILIDPKIIWRVNDLFYDFNRRYWFIIKSCDKYYVKIRSRLFWKDLKNPEKIAGIKKEMRKYLAAYHMSKRVFEWIFREGIEPGKNDPERYFNHLIETTNIVLDELPNPTMDAIVMAQLHDAIEDIPGVNYSTLAAIFWNYIAKWVEMLSKKEIEDFYLSKYDLELLERLPGSNKEWRKAQILNKAKDARVDNYFWHLDELDDNMLTVKFADRIHNLRTLSWLSRDKILRKVSETRKYFLPIAKKRNKVAFKLINKELSKLK
jgi:predicted DNA-binding protein (MmcQ/YjbR family)